QIKLARQDLAKVLQRPMVEPTKAQHKAEDSLKQLDAIKQKIKADQQYAEAQNQIKSFKSLATPEDSGPVADAHRAIAKAEFSEAVDSLTKAVNKFEQMDQKEKEKAAQQMQ